MTNNYYSCKNYVNSVYLRDCVIFCTTAVGLTFQLWTSHEKGINFNQRQICYLSIQIELKHLKSDPAVLPLIP
jgi:hypothetical protein